MPLQSNLQLLKLHYREFLRKNAANHRSDGGDASAYNYYVERAYVEASFDQSFEKLSTAIASVSFSELRALYTARKERAKERLRRAFDAKVSRLNSYLSSSNASETSNAASTSEVTAHVPANAAATEERLASSLSSSSSSDGQKLQELCGSDGVLRRTVLYLLGHAARAYMTSLNTTRVAGLEVMAAALQRPAGQSLITVSNHVAALDDPLVVSVLLPEEKLQQPESVRWTLCASDRCFRYQALVPLFRAAKVLPVVRGGGLAQPGMAAAEARLAAGDWVHIFPEGTRSADGVTLGAVRKGVGRLVAAAPPEGPPPLVVPFVHRGMEEVLPRGAVLPAVGQQIDVLVGDPIPVADLLAAARADHWPADRLHTAVAARVSHGLGDLRRRLDVIRAGDPDPGPEGPPAGSAGGVSSLDQFDPADLRLAAEVRAARRRRDRFGSGGGGVSGAWERLKFRMVMQHRSWATQGHGGGGAQMPRAVLGVQAEAYGGAGLAAAGGALAPTAAQSLPPPPPPPLQQHMQMHVGGVSPYLRQVLGLGPAASWASARFTSEGGR